MRNCEMRPHIPLIGLIFFSFFVVYFILVTCYIIHNIFFLYIHVFAFQEDEAWKGCEMAYSHATCYTLTKSYCMYTLLIIFY